MDKNDSSRSLYGVYNDLFNRHIPSDNPDSQDKKDAGDVCILENSPLTETPDDVKKEIEALTGMINIKNDIEALMDFVKVQKLREKMGLPVNEISLHTAFIGNPGTGKTTVARLMGRYFKALGILKKGHLIEVNRSDLVAGYVGQTAAMTSKVIDSALDGILFIDEAYSLTAGDKNDFGREAVNMLVDRMEKERNRLAVFLAGYDQNMKDFFNSNPGLASRVTRKFYFNDFNGDELTEIFYGMSKKNKYVLDKKAGEDIKKYFDYIYYVRDDNFGNGRDVRNTFEKLLKCQADRIAGLDEIDINTLTTITAQDVENTVNISGITVQDANLDNAVKELDNFVGMEEIKDHITTLVNMVKTNRLREEHKLPVRSLSYHAIFCGPPGTGKTSVARILGKIFKALGILKKGHIIEVDRSGLVGAYMGQTESRTDEVVKKAIDGILFIDEAYSLSGSGQDYGKKAMEIILKRMDDLRERLVVIAAGYTKEMELFIDSNPGLRDRFTQKFEFNDFTPGQLVEITDNFAAMQHYTLDEKARESLLEYYKEIYASRDRSFGNGRLARNLFERMVMAQSNRLSKITGVTKDDLTVILKEDVMEAI